MEEYAHARHLWHRFKEHCPPDFHAILNQEFLLDVVAVAMENEPTALADTTVSSIQALNQNPALLDLYQFYVLWQLMAKPMLQYQSNIVFVNAKRILSVKKRENTDTSLNATPSSFYEPLLTYVDQMVFSYQSQVLRRMEERYDVISESSLFLHAFGYPSTNTDGEEKNDSIVMDEMRNQIIQRGWKKSPSSNGFWIPASPSPLFQRDTQNLNVWNEEKIQSMIQTVAFLEKKLTL